MKKMHSGAPHFHRYVPDNVRRILECKCGDIVKFENWKKPVNKGEGN